MCEGCDGLCKLDRDELLAILQVRLERLSSAELKALNVFVFEWKRSKKTAE